MSSYHALATVTGEALSPMSGTSCLDGLVVAGSPRATRLAEAAAAVGVGATLRQLEKAWASLDRRLPTHPQVLGLLAPEPYRQALDLTVLARVRVRTDVRSANSFAGSAAVQLRRALADGAAELARRERQAVAGLAVQAVRNLGYSVQWCDGKRTTAVEARRDHELVLLTIADGGELETDHAGVAEATHPGRQNDLVTEMARLGVELSAVRRPTARGGGLIAVAVRHGEVPLARALIREKEGRARPQRARTIFRRRRPTAGT